MKKKLGKPLAKISENYIDPAPTTEETDQIAELWDIYAPEKYKGLMRSQNKTALEQTGTKPTSAFVWDDKTRRYIETRTGRVIPMSEIHIALRSFMEAYARR